MAKHLAGKTSSGAAVDLPFADAAALDRLASLVPDRDPEVVVLLVALTRLARRNDELFARLAARHGLLPSETSVLVALWWAGPPHRVRPTVLADGLLQTSGGMTATLRRLEAAGFVERVPDPADGRVVLAGLTEAGRRAAAAALDDQTAHVSEALAAWTPAARRRALVVIRDLLEAIEPPEGSGPLTR